MRAHDIRRLLPCDGCGQLGMINPFLDDSVRGLIRTPSGRTLHPTCISEPLLLKCIESQLVAIRIADVGRELFERVTDELIRRRGAELDHV